MDEVSGKRAVDKLPLSKRSSHVMRDSSGFTGRSPQPCNRIGCSSRLDLKSGQGGVGGCPQKAKSVRSSVFLSGKKEVPGSSSKNVSSVSAIRNPKKEAPKKVSLLLETDSSESSSIRDELEVPEVIDPPGKIQKGAQESSKKGLTTKEVGSSSSGSATVLGSRNSSNIKNLPSSKAKSVRQQPTNPTTSQGLRNLRCNSAADAVPSSSSSPQNRSLSKRKEIPKGRVSEGETSTSRGKKTDETFPSSRNGLSISESRRTRNGGLPEAHRGVASVRVRRSPGSPSERVSSSPSNESRFTFSRLTRRDLPREGNSPSSGSSYELPSESALRRFTISNRPGSSSRLSAGGGPSSPDSFGITSWESFQQYTMDGIAEVLSALERIDRDDLSYEQLLSLENNLFLNNLNIYDQHRDMRMDIDNMSYEELLALEERMGTVSTALTEDDLLKCLKREPYRKSKCDDEAADCVENNGTKCSICQEEYADDDEVGRLRCEHSYHVDCINEWLRLKNWCPICKGSAAEPSASSPAP